MNYEANLLTLIDLYTTRDVDETPWKSLSEQFGKVNKQAKELVTDLMILKQGQKFEEVSTHPNSKQYGKFYNEQNYQTLLVISRLAYLEEQNGIAEDHALKLSVLFDSPKEALDYIKKLAIISQDKPHYQPIHDACLFTLPEVTKVQFTKWKKLVKQNRENPKVMNLLANATTLEAMFNKKSTVNGEQRKEIEALKKEVEKANQAFKKLKRHHGNLTDVEEPDYMASIKTLQEANAKLALASRNLSFSDSNYTILNACYENYKLQQDGILQYLTQHGLTESNYEKFKALERQDNDELIPNVHIDGQSFGYPGYYLRKVPVLHEQQAARAACLGKLTNCCQSLSGEAGEPCVIHGLTSVYGGFYVLCKGDSTASLADQVAHPVIAQSWVWRSQNNAIVFDSVEMGKDVPDTEENIQLISKFIVETGDYLIKNQCASKVVCGKDSGISNSITQYELTGAKELFVDYHSYCDSKDQALIIDSRSPFQFYTTSPHSKAETHRLTELAMGEPTPLVNHPFLRSLLNWALLQEEEPIELLQQVDKIAEKMGRTPELIDIKDFMQKYVERSLPAEEVITGIRTARFHVTTVNDSQCNVLHEYADEPQILKAIMDCNPDGFTEAVTASDAYGETPLHIALRLGDCFGLLFESLTPSDKLNVLTQGENYDTPILFAAVSHPKSLKRILESYLEAERVKALEERNKSDETVLHLATNPESIMRILKNYPQEKRIHLLEQKNCYGNSALQLLVATHPENVKAVLSCFTANQGTALLEMEFNVNGKITNLSRLAKQDPQFQEAVKLFKPTKIDRGQHQSGFFKPQKTTRAGNSDLNFQSGKALSRN